MMSMQFLSFQARGMWPRGGSLVLLAVALWCCGAARSSAAPAFPAEFTDPPAARFVVSKDPNFGPPRAAARKLLQQEKLASTVNHFCVVGYRFGNGQAHAWVHWKEQQRLLLWMGGLDEETRVEGLVTARRDLKLGKDTVETADDIKGSTYLVTRAWWQAVAKDCAAHGEQITVRAARAQAPR